MDAQTAKKVLENLAADMSANKEVLINLDRLIGDGDLGITMEKGFAAAFEDIKNIDDKDVGNIFVKAGASIVKNAPSTMGTLMGSGLMRAGKALLSKTSLNAEDMKVFLESFLNGIIDRGKAKPGEKTIIDVLLPAVESMKEYKGDSIFEIWKIAQEGAERGALLSKNLISQRGKAAVFREKTKGLEDPGGRAVLILIQSIAKTLSV
ncbi:MAG: dihydroxyacetone kinase subunit L [Elusimicrobiota bacterium]|jgi:dihydroxyacetone kinase-like protein|nr:dihydroxyacetone kinase subunit L [Elusimicrobiota bacterium]